MPSVRVLRTFRRGDTGDVCRRDTVVDVPAAMAEHLVAQGYAVTGEAESQAEAAESEQVEAEATPRERGGRRRR